MGKFGAHLCMKQQQDPGSPSQLKTALDMLFEEEELVYCTKGSLCSRRSKATLRSRYSIANVHGLVTNPSPEVRASSRLRSPPPPPALIQHVAMCGLGDGEPIFKFLTPTLGV